MRSRRRISSGRATSSVVAAALFLAAMLVVFNALFLISSQYGSFFGNAMGKMRVDYYQKTERMNILRISITPPPDKRLNLTVTNQGPLTIRIVSIWISEWNGLTADWHRNRPTNVFVAPGNTTTNIGRDFPDTLDPKLTYALRIVTGRGNVFSATYSPLAGNVSPGFLNTGFLTISFEPASFLYVQGTSCTWTPAWDVPGSSSYNVWKIQVTNHGVNDIKLYKWSAMGFIELTSGSGGGASQSFTQETFFIVGKDSCYGHMTSFDFNSPDNLIPKYPAGGDAQTGGTPTWVWFSASTAGAYDTQNIQWGSPSEYMIFMVFYFLYGPSEQYTQVIPFAGVHFT